MLNAKPVLDRVLIKINDAPEKMGVLFIPDTAKKKPKQGVIVAVGNTCTIAKVNDEAIYEEFSGREVEINGERFILVRETELLIIL